MGTIRPSGAAVTVWADVSGVPHGHQRRAPGLGEHPNLFDLLL